MVEGYDIEGLLGAGASGELWLARDQASRDQVALKRFRPRDEEAKQRARRMVNVLEQLDHPGLLHVREMLPYGEDFVLVLDHAEGGTLDQLLMARGTLHPGEMVTIATALAEALSVLHDRGLVHGEVTPESIVFTADGRPMLTDMGLLALIDGGEALGTLGYADPAGGEQGSTVASDVYGLAAVCYTALSGTTLDPQQQRRPLHQVAPGVPPGLAHAVEAGLQAAPSARPDASSFGHQLRSAANPEPVRFPDGSTGPAFTVPGQGFESDPFVLGGDDAGSAGGAGAGQSLFAREQPLAEPTTGFTPPGLQDYADEDDEDRPRRKPRKPRQQKRPRPDGAADGDERPGLLHRPLLVLGIPLLLLVLVGGFIAVRSLVVGPATPEGDQTEVILSGPHAQKWVNVLDELDQRVSAAYAAGDPSQLEQAYAPGSDPLLVDQQNMRNALLDPGWEGARNFHSEVLSLRVDSESRRQVVLSVVTRRGEYTAFGEKHGEFSVPAGSPKSFRITLVPDDNGGWVIGGSEGGSVTSSPTPEAQ